MGARVSYYRKLKNYSQLELAEMCGMSETYICRIENARAKGITLEACVKLADVLEVDVERLIRIDDNV